LATEHPLHERLCCLLALALYRGGRQADALERIGRLKEALADELGVDPTPETMQMHLRLLQQTRRSPRHRAVASAHPGASSSLPAAHLRPVTTTFVGAAPSATAARPALRPAC